jgi:stress-induced morphogen
MLHCVEQAVPDAKVTLRDDSHKHASHYDTEMGAGTHIHLTVNSLTLNSMAKIEAHRVINNSLEHLMPEPIHALSIKLI